MSLEKVRSATKEELAEIKALKKGILDYLKSKEIDDGLILSSLCCLTIETAMEKKVERRNLFKLLRAIWQGNYKPEKLGGMYENIAIIKELIVQALDSEEFDMMEITVGLTSAAIGAAIQLGVLEKDYLEIIRTIWKEKNS